MKLIVNIIKSIIKYLFYGFVLINLLILIIPLLFSSSCKSNDNLHKFDVIIVLGSPSNTDCTPHIIMKTRVDKAIELFNKELANKIIFTGAAVQNTCSEASVMAKYALANGIPKTAVIIEDQAQNTYQNAINSVKIMDSLDLKSAAIVTSKPHLKRACLYFGNTNINYKMIGADYPKDISTIGKVFWFMGERMLLTHLIIFGKPTA